MKLCYIQFDFKKFTIFLLSLILFAGCGRFCPKKTGVEISTNKIMLTSEQENNINLKTDVVKYRNVDDTVKIQAHIQAIDELINHIYSPVDGKAVKVFVIPGEIIQKGKSLALVQSDTVGQIELDLLQQIIQADSDIKQASVSLYLSENDFKREDELLKERITSKSDWETAKTQMEKDRAMLSSTKAKRFSIITVYQQRLSLYGANSGIARQVVASKHIYPYITLYSNKNGVLLSRTINNGEVVSQGKEAFTIADISKVWLVGNAYEKDALKLHVGNLITASLDNFKNLNFSGKLIYIAPMLDPQNRTLEVRAELNNKLLKLKPNMYAQMTAYTGKYSILSVPASALEKYGDYTYAFVSVKPHVYEERKIKTGISNKDYVEILDGLKPDETIVTNGAFALLGEALKKQS